MPTVAFTTITDPIISTNVSAVSASGTTDANTNTVAVTVTDELGTVAGPFSAVVAALAWTVASADLSALADGPVAWKAVATALDTTTAAAVAAGTKASTKTYATITQFRNYIRDPSSTIDQAVITTAIAAASRQVEGYTGRHYYQQTQVQYFTPDPANPWILALDDMDLATTSGMAVLVEFGIDGTYPETRTFGTDFIAQPINQSMAGIDGWPYTSLQSVNGKLWPPKYADFQRDTVKITATWGWPAVPDPVVESTLMLASMIYKMGEAPFGVAGFDNFGAVRVKNNPVVMELLRPYKKHTTLLMA